MARLPLPSKVAVPRVKHTVPFRDGVLLIRVAVGITDTYQYSKKHSEFRWIRSTTWIETHEDMSITKPESYIQYLEPPSSP